MRKVILPLLAIFATGVIGCESSGPSTPAEQTAMNDNSQVAVERMGAQDSTLPTLLNSSYGYVIFPDIGSGAVGIGGASGKGIVYRGGEPIGTVRLTEISAGLDIGGQTFSEIIVFQNEKAFNRLLNDSVEFGADAKITVLKAGAAGSGNFVNGVEVFVMTKGGLQIGVNLNGQKFHYDAFPTATASPTPTPTPTTNPVKE